MIPDELTNKLTELWKMLFQVNPVFAIGLLMFLIWQFLLKPLFLGGAQSGIARTSVNEDTSNNAELVDNDEKLENEKKD